MVEAGGIEPAPKGEDGTSGDEESGL